MKKFIKKWWPTVVAFLIGFILASIAATPTPTVKTVTQTKTVEVVKTPQSCKDVISIDNDIFTTIGNSIVKLDFQTITDKVTSVTNERTAKTLDCLSK